ncbi:DNA repair protein SWI5 homolog isoform X1 [Syngnathus typhle]|uniref:DNA repair protein SWI5 homolog isoform X1 n=1 Tax=Syngnathus typhle TaxID=161592 RepID=UPI002A6B71E3|nr:DNA repair protein SWI5 homolog isoform X1 [Syngnathus typhle]
MNSEQLSEDIGKQNNSASPISTPEGNNLKRGLLKRTPFSKMRKVHSNFKSPDTFVLFTSQGQITKSCKLSPEEEVEELEKRSMQLDTEIAQLEMEGYNVEELDCHIDMLHEYNDIKDIGQSLLGRIAALRGTTVRDLYSHFGLELED